MMRKQLGIAMVTGMLASPVAVQAQGIPGGAERGAAEGSAVAGPVGAVVGAVVGGVMGGIGGLLGVEYSTAATVPCGEKSRLAGGQQPSTRVR